MMYGWVEVQLFAFLPLGLDGGEWLASYPSHLTPTERVPSTHWTGGWVGHRAGLDKVVKWKNPFIAPAKNWTLVIQPIA